MKEKRQYGLPKKSRANFSQEGASWGRVVPLNVYLVNRLLASCSCNGCWLLIHDCGSCSTSKVTMWERTCSGKLNTEQRWTWLICPGRHCSYFSSGLHAGLSWSWTLAEENYHFQWMVCVCVCVCVIYLWIFLSYITWKLKHAWRFEVPTFLLMVKICFKEIVEIHLIFRSKAPPNVIIFQTW